MKTPRDVLLNRHRAVEPKLERMWPSVAVAAHQVTSEILRQAQDDRHLGLNRWSSGVVRMLWQELIVPSRGIWAGVACAWVVIGVLNMAFSEPTTKEVANRAKPPSQEEMRVLIEQRRMLAQLIGPLSEPAYTQKRATPGPHSERAAQTAAV